MEGNGMLPGLGSSLLGLELPLHPLQLQHQQHHPNNSKPQQQHPYQPQHQQQQQQQQHPQVVSFTSYDATDHHTQSPQSLKQNAFPYPTKIKQQQQQQHQLTMSDEEEHVDDGGGDGRKQVSSWQRVKWTDSMIRLLIMVVFYVEDDGQVEGNDAMGKKRPGGALQKKGKWKSVSRAMMEKGFFVSPQQCEDKFNDLNKRYKRVNDIIGKGTACRVVENHSLLDTMDHIPPKMKEEVRKLLSSKHLFFREMCAYHNSGGVAGGHHQATQVAAESSHHHQQNQQHCFESSGMVGKGASREEDDEDEEEEDEEEEDSEEEDDNQHCGGSGVHEDEDNESKFSSKKRPRGSLLSPPIQKLSSELISLFQDGTKSPEEQRQWMRNRVMQLEEQQVNYQYEAFELEKQRFKWVKFKEEKEREMEKLKLNNERMKFESDRMILLLRKKELELFNLHQQRSPSTKQPNNSSIAG